MIDTLHFAIPGTSITQCCGTPFSKLGPNDLCTHDPKKHTCKKPVVPPKQTSALSDLFMNVDYGAIEGDLTALTNAFKVPSNLLLGGGLPLGNLSVLYGKPSSGKTNLGTKTWNLSPLDPLSWTGEASDLLLDPKGEPLTIKAAPANPSITWDSMVEAVKKFEDSLPKHYAPPPINLHTTAFEITNSGKMPVQKKRRGTVYDGYKSLKDSAALKISFWHDCNPECYGIVEQPADRYPEYPPTDSMLEMVCPNCLEPLTGKHVTLTVHYAEATIEEPRL